LDWTIKKTTNSFLKSSKFFRFPRASLLSHLEENVSKGQRGANNNEITKGKNKFVIFFVIPRYVRASVVTVSMAAEHNTNRREKVARNHIFFCFQQNSKT
jgi:hypothetical protein